MNRLTKIFAPMFALLLFSACSASDDADGENVPETKDNYINLAISVGNGESASTRAGVPNGGEDGDGREYGFERENAIGGITLILYQATGIDAAATTPISFVAYYPVTKTTKDTDTRIEATYETGNQRVPHNAIDFTKAYRAIIVANADLTSTITTSSTLGNVRDLTLSQLYSGGDETKPAEKCMFFVMSSEKDQTLNFAASGVKTTDAAGDHYYNMTTQPLVIERMAARIDFWSKNSNGYKTSAENPAYTIPGYEYNVGSTTDKFVVTGIVPFNLTNGDATYGKEYLIKRLRTDISDASTTRYLIDETTTTYVIDPKTTDKQTATTPALKSSLEGVYTLIGDATKLENTSDNPFYHSIETMHASSAKMDIESKENIVVVYPMENCLLPESKLYYHATGVAIVGYYYQGGTGTGTRLVYLGYLCHQGDAATYDILPYTTPLGVDATMGSTTAMKYGVVRNNIYRICINNIDSKGSIELAIKVKKWDPFTHSWIYM